MIYYKKNTFAVISFMWFLFLWNGHCRKIKNPIFILDLYVGIWNYESKRFFYTFKRHFWLYHGVQFFSRFGGREAEVPRENHRPVTTVSTIKIQKKRSFIKIIFAEVQKIWYTYQNCKITQMLQQYMGIGEV